MKRGNKTQQWDRKVWFLGWGETEGETFHTVEIKAPPFDQAEVQVTPSCE